ncbi:PQQ-binding-like beta-propeller repeat protein [Streptosporangium sp. NPDC023615]|uniref:serine/threonine-protein kinase n=1 Tax=Streptosporangium sp. NPDC023615 TaxID=3154794 RepID=UPI0034165EC8
MEPLRADDPHRIGPYRVLARLGSGGMGVVYLGRSRSGRLIAVKVIRRHLAADPEYRARFRREVTAARRVIGAFTAPVLDADPEAPWLATAYLPGMTLREAVDTFGPIPPESLRALAGGLAEALAAIHRAGVVHRDLKPANVLLTAGGPRVIDFGIARPSGEATITQRGVPIGTPGFMAPEQVAGVEVGPASDVFTLGVVLAYAAGGVEPFGTGPAGSRQYRIMTGQADLDGIGQGWLRDMVVDCLRPDPARRPSAGEVLRRLGEQGAVSLQGTRWLPPAVADEIDRRTARTVLPPAPAIAPVGPEGPDGPGRPDGPGGPRAAEGPVDAPGLPEEPGGSPVLDDAVMNMATAEPFPVAPGGPRGVRRRSVIAGTAVGALAAGGLGALLWSRGEPPAAAPEPRPPRSDPSRSDPSRSDPSRSDPSRSGAPPSSAEPPRAVRRWRVKSGDYYADLFLCEDLVLVRGEAGDTYAVDPRTGRVRWKRRGELAGTSGGLAFLISSRSPHMSAVSPRDGRTLWIVDVRPGFSPLQAVVTGPVACVGGVGGGERLMGLDARDGRVRWSATVTGLDGFTAGGGTVAAAGHGELTGLRARDGRRRWSYPIGEAFGVSYGEGLFLVSDTRYVLHAVRADTGKRAWRRVGAGNGFLLQAGGGMVYADAGDGVLAMRATTGETVWSRALGAGAPQGYGNALGLYGGTLYVGGTDRRVHALDPATGRVLWTYGADMTLRSGPVSAGGLVFVATRDGYVNALAPPDGTRG